MNAPAIDIERYYNRYGAMVYRRCLAIVGEREPALDLMQDVFVNLIRNAARLTAQGPSSLLYTMATNLSLNHLRSKNRRPQVAIDGVPESALIAAGGNAEEAALARHFLDRLFSEDDEKTALIAWMHYVDGLTLEETASQVGMSVSGIRKRLRKLRRRGNLQKEA